MRNSHFAGLQGEVDGFIAVIQDVVILQVFWAQPRPVRLQNLLEAPSIVNMVTKDFLTGHSLIVCLIGPSTIV